MNFRTSRCVFIGYNSSHKGYKCLDQSTCRVYISRVLAAPKTAHHSPVLLPTLSKPTTYTKQSLIDTQNPIAPELVIDNSHVNNGQNSHSTNGQPGASMFPAGVNQHNKMP
jgi:hypothetical protein